MGGALFVVPEDYRHGMDPAEYPSHATNVRPGGNWEKPANESWPAPEVARKLNDVDLAKQIPVTVRLEFTTGEEQLPGIAVRWNRTHVYVRMDDRRLQSGGVWVRPADVRRR